MICKVIKSLLLDNQIFHFSKFKEFPNDENVTKQKPFQRVEMENIRKKNSIRSFTELKKKQSNGFSSKPNCFSNYKNVCKVI